MFAKEIAEALDRLIEAHERLRWAQRLLEEFLAENDLPEPPEFFEDVDALVHYNTRKERYEDALRSLMQQRSECEADYERLASPVEPLLPVETRLIHVYGGNSPNLTRGKRYVVHKAQAFLEDSPVAVPQETRSGDLSALAYVVRVEEVTG